MSLIHYARPFLELGICKEYCMARKTTGSTTTKRSKKTEVPVVPAAVQVAPEVHHEVHSDVRTDVRTEVRTEVRKDVPRNGKPIPVNLEEEIRRRAYELYLQRRATAGAEHGNEDQDWLIAEREILSRYDKLALHTTA